MSELCEYISGNSKIKQAIDFFSNGEEKILLVRFDNSNYVKNGILILNFNLIVFSRCFPTLNKYLLNSYSLSH